jgi:hypothetical protein
VKGGHVELAAHHVARDNVAVAAGDVGELAVDAVHAVARYGLAGLGDAHAGVNLARFGENGVKAEPLAGEHELAGRDAAAAFADVDDDAFNGLLSGTLGRVNDEAVERLRLDGGGKAEVAPPLGAFDGAREAEILVHAIGAMADDLGDEQPALLLMDVVGMDQSAGREGPRAEAAHGNENGDAFVVDILDAGDVGLALATEGDIEPQGDTGQESLGHEGILTRWQRGAHWSSPVNS